MAYNLRSRLTSEGSSVALRSEGLNLSPVELAVPMSEQTPTTAGHGLDLLGPVVIEGSPEALQTVAMPAPSLSQIDSDTAAETDEQTEMLNATMVPTPAMHLAVDTTHPASSVYGAGAAGTGPPPSDPEVAPLPVTSMDPCSTDPTYRDPYYRDLAASSDPSIGRCIDGYIQQLGFIPFVCVFYKEEQVEAYINQCKDDQPCVEHFDATGSVVARRCTTEDQPVYFYSMIMRRGNMPFLEFLSNRHSGSFVCGIIMNFLASVRSCNNGNTVVPQTVVVDFSYALMGAVLLSFNSMTLTQYLLHTFQILRHGDDGRHRMTTVVICCAHMTHAAARRMTLKESNRDKRRNAMIMFTALQRADNLSVARSVYHDASVVLCSEYNNDRCKQAYRRLMAVARRLHANSYCDEDEVEQPETETVSDDHDYTQVETKKTLKVEADRM